jgi:hypothetical protein
MLPRILNQRDSRLDTADAAARTEQQPTQTKAFKLSNAQYRHFAQQRVVLTMALDAPPLRSDLELRNSLECYMKLGRDSLRLHMHATFDANAIVSVWIRRDYGSGCRETTPEASISRTLFTITSAGFPWLSRNAIAFSRRRHVPSRSIDGRIINPG